uniref:Uncharacterized protein n=1 Tax=Rhizophora mucronata TaxID=61149 RepID=A0A2P2IRS3_RHIMU
MLLALWPYSRASVFDVILKQSLGSNLSIKSIEAHKSQFKIFSHKS